MLVYQRVKTVIILTVPRRPETCRTSAVRGVRKTDRPERDEAVGDLALGFGVPKRQVVGLT